MIVKPQYMVMPNMDEIRGAVGHAGDNLYIYIYKIWIPQVATNEL